MRAALVQLLALFSLTTAAPAAAWTATTRTRRAFIRLTVTAIVSTAVATPLEVWASENATTSQQAATTYQPGDEAQSATNVAASANGATATAAAPLQHLRKEQRERERERQRLARETKARLAAGRIGII